MLFFIIRSVMQSLLLSRPTRLIMLYCCIIRVLTRFVKLMLQEEEQKDKYKSNLLKHWDLPPVGWLKWKRDAFRIEARTSTTIGNVCRDDNGPIQDKNGKIVGDCSIL